MPYVQNTYVYPAPGKGPEIRKLLEDRVRSAPERDERSSLRTQVWFDEGPVFTVSTLHADLPALERSRDRGTADPTAQQLRDRIGQLTRRPARLELFENLLPVVGASGTPPRYYLRAVHHPQPGKGPEVRALLAEHAESRRAAGARITLLAQVFAPKGIAFVLGSSAADFAEIERRRQESGPILAALGARLGPLLRHTVQVELNEILVPFPS